MALLGGEILLYLVLNIGGLELAVRAELVVDSGYLLVCLGGVSVDLDQDRPREPFPRISVVVENHGGGLGIEQRADLEVVVDASDGESVTALEDGLGCGFIDAHLAEGVFVEPPGGLSGVVVLFLTDAQYLKVGVISPELLEGD